MPRELVLGNGSLLVNFDREFRMRDLYYPFVGKENHVGGALCRFGLWVDGAFTWFERAHGWRIDLGYQADTLVGRMRGVHDKMRIEIDCAAAVDFHAALLVRRLDVRDLSGQSRRVRLYFHHDFRISENEVGDTAAFDPATKSLVHYKGSRYFLINVAESGSAGVEHWAIGQKGTADKEGTWRDAEDDGNLGGNPIAQGAVDSVVAAHVEVPAGGSAVVHQWLAVGPTWKGNWDSVAELNAKVVQRGADSYLKRTRDYWILWVNKEPIDFFDLPAEVIELYKRSLLVLRTQIDNGGAIIAANDSDITTFNRDTYSYLWPRDGALVAHALDLAGYPEPPLRFFEFCADVLAPDGYLLHKYTPDKALGSSWHPWIGAGGSELPIQEDETALVLWALWKHFQRYRDIEHIRGLYGRLVKKAGKFLLSYRDPSTGLPLPSWDLWEERRGVLTYTCATVAAGLHAAAEFAFAFGEGELAHRFEVGRREVVAAMDKHLWRADLGRFARAVQLDGAGGVKDVDAGLDASLWGLFAFGTYPADDQRVKATMRAVRERLWCKTEVGGLARYENDYYHQVSKDIARIPGNPWYICTLWLAQHAIAAAATRDDLRPAIEMLQWTAARRCASGVLAEQVHPTTGEPLSVSPLTWSHATVVTVVQEYLDRCEALEFKPPGSIHRYRKIRGYERPEPAIS